MRKRNKKRRRFSIHRLTTKFASFGKNALECIRTFPAARREVPVNVVDVVSALCMLGVTAVMILALLANGGADFPSA